MSLIQSDGPATQERKKMQKESKKISSAPLKLGIDVLHSQLGMY